MRKEYNAIAFGFSKEILHMQSELRVKSVIEFLDENKCFLSFQRNQNPKTKIFVGRLF